MPRLPWQAALGLTAASDVVIGHWLHWVDLNRSNQCDSVVN